MFGWFRRTEKRLIVNPVEKILLNFLKNELLKNPQLAGGVIQHLLQQTKLDPTIINDVIALIEELLPVVLGAIKV